MAEQNPHIQIQITNPAGTPTVIRNEIWRSETGAAGSFIRIAASVAPNALYKDFQVARAKSYWYFNRAIADNGTSIDSATYAIAVTWNEFDWLTEVDGANPAKFRWYPNPQQRVAVQGDFLEFDGRSYPLGYTGEGTQETWDQDFTVNLNLDGAEQWDALRYLVDTRRGRDLLWRDKLGNLIYARVLEVNRTPSKPGPRAQVTFKLTRVDHSVAV